MGTKGDALTVEDVFETSSALTRHRADCYGLKPASGRISFSAVIFPCPPASATL